MPTRAPSSPLVCARGAALAFAAVLSCVPALAQYRFDRVDGADIRVTGLDGATRRHLAVGGYNNVEVSSADLRNTGRPSDYYVFDRAGDVHTALAPDGQGGYVDLTALTSEWPRASFISLLRDYNRDGVPDLFVSSAAGGREGLWVYTGSRDGDRIRFTQVDFGGAFGQNLAYGAAGGDLLYVARTDLPAIQDLDGDGDLDILAFDASGSYIYYYRNVAAGAGASPADHLRFELASPCYGGVYEDGFSAELILASAPGRCATPFTGPGGDTTAQRPTLHPGSTLTPYDADCDGDLDLLVGDVASTTLALLTNTPAAGGLAYFTAVQTPWPGTESAPAVALDFFPAAFAVEPPTGPNATCPGALVVAPTNTGGGEDIDAQWLYAAQATGGELTLQTRSLFSSHAFDHGTGTHFAIADLDADQRPEVLVGVEWRYRSGAPVTRVADLRLYRGTNATGDSYLATEPAWLRRLNTALPEAYLSLDPAFADLDGDGRPDLLVGHSEGGLAFAKNLSTAGVIDFAAPTLDWQGIRVGIQSSPAVGDVNGDGLPDLLIGERAGNINLFLNRGSAQNPVFAATPDDEAYAQIDVRLPGFNTSGLSRPAIGLLYGRQVLVVGSGQGRLLTYGDLPAGPGGRATLLHESQVRAGVLVDPTFTGRVSPEGRAELWLGNLRGGFEVYASSGTVGFAEAQPLPSIGLSPNPSHGPVRLRGLPTGQGFSAEVLDALGRSRYRGRVDAETVDVPQLPAGVYTLLLCTPDGQPAFVARLVRK